MSNLLKKQIVQLVKLQSIENEQFKIKKHLQDIPNKIKELKNKRETYKQELDDEKSRLEAVKKEYRDYESSVKDNLEKAKRSEIKLAEVKNNKEYQSILKEIDELKSKSDDMEDKMLERLDFLDQEEERLTIKQNEFDAVKKEIEEDEKEIYEDSEKQKERLSILEKQKQDVLINIDAPMLEQYEKVRTVVGRTVMARAEKELCHACNMNMPPQKYNELIRCEEIIFCPHCHRILYWEKESETT